VTQTVVSVSVSRWVHRLSEVDPEARTGTCASCGPVDLYGTSLPGGRTKWRCAEAVRSRPRRPAGPAYRRHKGGTCEQCGFVPEHACQLDVHHLDGDSRNHDPANLQTLCANCHRLVSYDARMTEEGRRRMSEGGRKRWRAPVAALGGAPCFEN
jgi:HNH endonuclease